MFVARRPDNSIYGCWSVRQFEGQEELPDDHPDLVTFRRQLTLDELAVRHVDAIDRLQFEHLFDLENRMRAQESLGAITRAQYRTALINRWKTLNS